MRQSGHRASDLSEGYENRLRAVAGGAVAELTAVVGAPAGHPPFVRDGAGVVAEPAGRELGRLEADDQGGLGAVGDGGVAELAGIVGSPTMHTVIEVGGAHVRLAGDDVLGPAEADHRARSGVADGGAVAQLAVVV